MNLTRMKEILDAREMRAGRQKSLLKAGGCLISFTLNIPGPVKVSRIYEIAFDEGIYRIEEAISAQGFIEAESERIASAAGYVFFARLLTEDIRAVKTAMIGIEERDALGRLMDIDVLLGRPSAGAQKADTASEVPAPPVKISRTDLGHAERGCLLCGGPVFTCLRTGRHKVPEVLMRVVDILLDTPAVAKKLLSGKESEELALLIPMSAAESSDRCDSSGFAERTALKALRAILYEVITTPKPGLVDAENNGAHDDMDITTFFDSAAAIAPYFAACVQAGIRMRNERPEAVLEQIRPLGIEAEKRMYAATGGVNTHKGAVFSFGVICAAAGMLKEKYASVDAVLALAGKICAAMPPASRGIRDEAMAGYPSVRLTAFPYMSGFLKQLGIEVFRGDHTFLCRECSEKSGTDSSGFGSMINEAGVRTLVKLISVVDDSNTVRRCGEDTARKSRLAALELCEDKTLESDTPAYFDRVKQLDKEYIKARVSPGGCADLLAITYFLVFSCS